MNLTIATRKSIGEQKENLESNGQENLLVEIRKESSKEEERIC